MRAATVLLVALMMAGLGSWAAAQQGKGKAQAKNQNPAKKPGGVRAPVGLPPQDRAKGQDKAAKKDALADAKKAEVPGPYRLKFATKNGDYLSATYYLSNLKNTETAPVVLLVHDKGKQGSDFEAPIRELESKSLAEKLNADGYAVFIPDLRGHGDNPRPARDFGAKEWDAMAEDLQAAYNFLLDRHNHIEFNLAKFGVVGLGTGANLVAHWAARNDAATGPFGRPSDLTAVALVSPVVEAEGMKIEPDVAAFAFRVPTLVLAGSKDGASMDALEAIRKNVENNRFSKVVALDDSGLKAEFLLRLGAKSTEPLLKFLDSNVKLHRAEWEGRYRLDPLDYRDVRPVAKKKAQDKAEKKDQAAPEKAKGADADAKDKAKDQ